MFHVILVFTTVFLLSGSSFAKNSRGGRTPKAIFVISYDQMRGDYPEQFAQLWGEKGFKRIMKEGGYSPLCYFNHVSNVTCPGHAVLMTGSYPSQTGIVSNDFFDSKSGCMCYCTEDKSSPVTTNASVGRSPKLLSQTTLGDELRLKSPKSKALSFALKDRAAILMAGKSKQQSVYWFDWSAQRFTTSSYYHKSKWIDKLNATIPLSAYAGKTWNPSIPQSLAKEDSIPVEGNFPGGDFMFPHELGHPGEKHYAEAVMTSPYSISYLFDAVKYAMNQEHIGKDRFTDIVTIGVSTTDLIGHLFGPDSREIQELYIHADSILGTFIDHLDATMGRDNYIMVITSDHGVAPIPEFITKFGKVPVDAGRIQEKTFLQEVETEMKKRIYLNKEGSWIKHFEPPTLFINDELVESSGIEKAKIIDTMCAVLQSINGIAHAVPTSKIQQGIIPPGWDKELLEMFRNDIHPDRTGEVMFMVKPYWLFGPKPANHGTAYDYDRYVPLMFLGGSIQAAQIIGKTDPADIMPTLASILNINVKDRHGKKLDLVMPAAKKAKK
ncbi:MAG: alkaline phosphatase family protein [Candidatus Kapaibacteriota bacterium]